LDQKRNCLKLEKIDVFYGKARALSDVFLEVPEGEIVSLIGLNGAGKSTTLNVIAGLKQPSGGEVWFFDKKINSLPPHERFKEGLVLVPEGRRIFPYMSVLENIKMGAYLLKSKKEVTNRIQKVFERFPRLRERAKQNAGTLSGGEQQMVILACTVMSNPKLLMLDEPSLGLSPVVVDEVGRIVRYINSLGTTVLLVEQNTRLALKLAQKVYLLETGNIVYSGNSKNAQENDHIKKSYLGL